MCPPTLSNLLLPAVFSLHHLFLWLKTQDVSRHDHQQVATSQVARLQAQVSADRGRDRPSRDHSKKYEK